VPPVLCFPPFPYTTLFRSMETRGAAARFDPGTSELTFWASTQFPHTMRTKVAEMLGVPENRVRVIAPDVGGGFGAKIDFTVEDRSEEHTSELQSRFDLVCR